MFYKALTLPPDDGAGRRWLSGVAKVDGAVRSTSEAACTSLCNNGLRQYGPTWTPASSGLQSSEPLLKRVKAAREHSQVMVWIARCSGRGRGPKRIGGTVMVLGWV